MKKRLWLLLSGLCLLALCPQRASAQYYGVRVNVPMLLTGTVNASFEAAFAPHWSIDVPLMWNPVKTDKVQMRLLAIQPGVRYWLFEEYAGHFLGMHLAAAKYDIGGRRFHRKRVAHGAGLLVRLQLAALHTLEPQRGGRLGALLHAGHPPRPLRAGRPGRVHLSHPASGAGAFEMHRRFHLFVLTP